MHLLQGKTKQNSGTNNNFQDKEESVPELYKRVRREERLVGDPFPGTLERAKQVWKAT